MNDTTLTHDEKVDALEAFARAAAAPQSAGELVPVSEHRLPAERAVGAQQVAVYRDEARVLQKIKVLASAAGEDWFYRYPVKDKGKTSWIEGPSIKLANDVARIYGNNEIDCRAQDLGTHIMFHARFLDVETGYALTRPFQQRKGASKLGGSDEGRRDDITFQIGASKAIRNVVVNALQTFADFAFHEARNSLVSRIGSDLDRWRARVVERFGAQIDIRRVEAVVGRPLKEWLAPDVARVLAMGKAVADGMATWDESFPPLDRQEAAPTTVGLDKFADAAGGQSANGDGQGAAPEGAPRGPSDDGAAPDDDVRYEIVEKLLKLSAEKLPAEDRLESLDVTRVGLLDRYPDLATFIGTVVSTTADIINGKLKAAEAAKYLRGLIK